MKTTRLFILLLSSAALVTSCHKVGYKKTPGGMPYQLFKGSGKKINVGNIIKYNVQYKINGESVFTTYDKMPDYAPVRPESQTYDIAEIWTKLNVGDSVITTQMIDTFIKRAPGSIPSKYKNGDRLVSYYKIIAVFNSDSAVSVDQNMERNNFIARETAELEKYAAGKKIQTVRSPGGVLLQITNPGTGNLIDSGKYVSVDYTGVTLDGRKFDSNVDTAFHHVQPLSFSVGDPNMIVGFTEALKMLRLGATAKIFIPAMLAYGPQPPQGSILKPFDALIFDLTVTAVRDSAPPPPPFVKQRPPIKVDATQPKK